MACITLDLESEIEAAVLKAIEAGEGVVPGYFGTSPRENEEPVTYAITEALDYAAVMDDLLDLLKVGADNLPGRIKLLREAIARKYAEQAVDGVREARENALETL